MKSQYNAARYIPPRMQKHTFNHRSDHDHQWRSNSPSIPGSHVTKKPYANLCDNVESHDISDSNVNDINTCTSESLDIGVISDTVNDDLTVSHLPSDKSNDTTESLYINVINDNIVNDEVMTPHLPSDKADGSADHQPLSKMVAFPNVLSSSTGNEIEQYDNMFY